MSIAGVKSNTIIKKGQVDMDNKINNRVPHCVHQSVVEALDRLESQPYNKIHRYNGARKVLLIAACCVIAVIFMTGAAMFISDRERIEKRETELVDPYAEEVMESVTDNGITMTLNKFAMDYNMDYIYFTLKNENGVFEKQPEFDEITFDWIYYSGGIETKYGSLLGFTTLSVSDYDPENPSDTIHAVLRHPLPSGKMTLNFKGLKSTDGTINYADGFSFDIDIGTNRKVINDIINRSGFDEEDINNEFKQYNKKSEVLDYRFIDLDKTIEIEGCELKATSLYISPYQISLSLRDDMSKTVKIGELEYYPATLTTISTDYLRTAYEHSERLKTDKFWTPPQTYVIGEYSTKQEIDHEADLSAAQNKIWAEQGVDAWAEYLMNHDFHKTDAYKEIASIRQNPEYFDMLDAASYKLGVEFVRDSEASLIGLSFGNSGMYQPEGSEDWQLAAGVEAYIDRAVSIDEIQRIYFYKYSDPSVQIDVWVNK